MTLTPLCALLLAGLTSGLFVTCLNRAFVRSRRTELLLAALVAPLVSLPFAWLNAPACPDRVGWAACSAISLTTPQTVQTLLLIHAPALASVIAFLAALLIVGGAVAHGALQCAMLGRRIDMVGHPASERLRSRITQLSRHFTLDAPRLLILAMPEPVAFTYGVWRPTVVLSTWMVDELDADELDAVLAHELSHVVRRDYQLMLLATTLRNAFFYLPTSQFAHQRLCQEKEQACDDLAIAHCAQPLALASALSKVWQTAAMVRAMAPVGQALAGPGDMIENRLIRLLAADEAALTPLPLSQARSNRVPRFSLPKLSAVVLANSALLALVLGAMGCLRGI